MEMQEVEVIIDKNGQVQIVVRGASGLTCLDLTAPLEAALGGEIIAREMTAESQVEIQPPLEQPGRKKARVKGRR